MYEVDTSDVNEQVADLPPSARDAFDELITVLSLTPWNGEPAAHANPEGSVRFFPIHSASGDGFVYYLILEDDARVDVLTLIWVG